LSSDSQRAPLASYKTLGNIFLEFPNLELQHQGSIMYPDEIPLSRTPWRKSDNLTKNDWQRLI
jgi:hypothetical protein